MNGCFKGQNKGGCYIKSDIWAGDGLKYDGLDRQPFMRAVRTSYAAYYVDNGPLFKQRMTHLLDM